MSGMRGQKYERLFESDEEAPPHEQVVSLRRNVVTFVNNMTQLCYV